MGASRKIKILIFLVTVVLLVLMFPRGESLDSEVAVGTIWTKPDLIATTSFEILKDPKVYEAEKRKAAQKVYPIFIQRDENKCLKDLNYFLDSLQTIFKALPDSDYSKIILPLSQNSMQYVGNLLKRSNLFSSDKRNFKQFGSEIKSALNSVCKKGVLNLSYKQIGRDTISVKKDKYLTDIPTKTFYDIESARQKLKTLLTKQFDNDSSAVSAAYEIASKFVYPTLRYSETLTARARQAAMDKVPRNLGIVNENERIVSKHDRITPEIKLKIDSYRIAKGEGKSFIESVLEYLGKTFHVLMILLLFGLYLFMSRKKIYENNKYLFLISLIILITSFSACLIQFIDIKTSIDLLVLVPVGSLLLTIIFDSRVAFFGTVTIALLIGGLRGNDYIITLSHIVAGGFAVYISRNITTRNNIFKAFFYILGGYVLAILAFGFERFLSIEEILIEVSFAATNALISPVLAFGLLFLIEKFFKISTDLTFLELSDLNNPLLRELSQKAPGTFNHSLVLGTMVEEAASLIRANSLLARVGAYYHDIGKTYYPEAFVENQFDGKNIHDKLKPEQSAEIIIQHVEKGIELAKEHGLPQEIIDFIPMHHGTLLVSYFYEKAKKLYGEENVNEEDFRYKGPKPNTKETGLLMLADACESAVRAMDEIEPSKVENLVSNLIEFRLRDGQLDDTPLNFKDIKIIKDTFVKVLLNQHHRRVRYPQQDEMENENIADKQSDETIH